MNNNNYIEQKKNTHLYFKIGEHQYAINSNNILEIIKLPALDYPQKLPNNIVGLLKYNNFVINVIDIRYYLNIEVAPYSVNNELIIVKTDEVIFGIITDRVIGILPFDTSQMDAIPFVDNKMIIDSIYKVEQDTIFIINVYAVETVLKQHNIESNTDVTALFPQDEASKALMAKRTMEITNKAALKLASSELHVKNKYISFNLNNDYYCIALDYVKEVLKDTLITRVPGTPDFIEGIMNLRGDYITVINLKKFLGLPPSEKALEKKPVVIINCNELNLALLIDRINELFEYQEDAFVNSNEGYFETEFINNNVLYTVLNVDRISSDKKIIITDM